MWLLFCFVAVVVAAVVDVAVVVCDSAGAVVAVLVVDVLFVVDVSSRC